MKIFKSITLFIIVLSVFSCMSSEEDTFALQKTVFINDVENPGLPIYSEWGYNSFGAYVDRQAFASSEYNLPTKIIVNNDTLNILLKGKMNGGEASIKFSIKGYAIADYTDLTVLNNVKINLKSMGCVVTLTRDRKAEVMKIIEGSLQFKRVQNLFIDKQYTKSIVSGVFSFKTFFENEPVAISNGRFDLGIGYENFYNY